MMSIKKILVANRGEIAIRVMRSAKELGIKTVAVYSEADKLLPHASFADEAVNIGPAAASESYLVQDKIIEACKQTGADAIHPGYGFLSENASFAERVKKEGLIFIGPSPEAIRVMGDKLTSKQTVQKFNVPLVPGMDEPINDVTKAKKVANDIGYPVMIKASAGGGGKGMRIVNDPKDFEEQMDRAMSEARNSFGNDEVFIEKFISSPKHIEVQVLGDQHGNIIHLFERECSIQRRHQKVVEEAPSALLTPERRKQIGEAAVNVAKSCNYYGAGTVEFIADENMDFYFLEMNTRLQVEHPVTELITGIDLVKEQIAIANGEKLSFTQDDLSINGHSLEVRVYAEDPENNFLPDTGKLKTYIRPQGAGVRVDDGYEQGQDVSIYYDPMIAKLITYGKDRTEAIQRMRRAIAEYQITGVKTTLPFCDFVLTHKEFIDGSFTTKFVESHYNPETLKKQPDQETMEIAALIANELVNNSVKKVSASKATETKSRWKERARN
ncbi:acetyl-CoA carboxylase biotin carboxylase subunit [Ekhidna sp.]|uniref:acetyl-CoA carboxylase biotin carboxylase subunit n=1 Tax=Ekhidna sp. TaxID=2608089 RepID=UPI003513407B